MLWSGINYEGDHEVLGNESAQAARVPSTGMNVLTELCNRSVGDVLICCCDTVPGVPTRDS